MSNPRDEAATQKSTFDAEMAKALNEAMMPGFRQVAERAYWGLNRGGIEATVNEAFKKPEKELETGYEMAKTGVEEGWKYALKRSGAMFSPNLLTDAVLEANTKLGRERATAETQLELQKDATKLSSFYNLTNILNKEGGTFLDIARGSSMNWGNAVSMMDAKNPWAGAAAGAGSGAAMGTAVLPGWGTAVGALAGGIAGFFG